MTKISLRELDELNLRSTLLDNDLIYISASKAPFKTTYGILKEGIRGGIISGLFPSGSEGDGFIIDNGSIISRPLTISDINGLSRSTLFNRNRTVTYTNTLSSLSVNPIPLTQEYQILGTVYNLEVTTTFNIDAVIGTGTSRLDIVVLTEDGTVEYRKGIESLEPAFPEFEYDELLFLQVYVDENNTLVEEFVVSGTPPATNLSISNRGANTLDINSSTGLDATIPSATSTLSGLLNASDKQKLDLTTVSLPINLDATNLNLSGLISLSGMPPASSDLGTFDGLIISDNVTVKVALQELETSISNSGTDLSLSNRNISTLDISSSSGSDVTIPSATSLLSGLLTGTDKSKIDQIPNTIDQYAILFGSGSNGIDFDLSELSFNVNNYLGVGIDASYKLHVQDSDSSTSGDLFAAFQHDGIIDSAITFERGSTADFTTLNIGNAFSLKRNGNGASSIETSLDLRLESNDYLEHLNSSGIGKIRLSGNASVTPAEFGAYNSSKSFLRIANLGTDPNEQLGLTIAANIIHEPKEDITQLTVKGFSTQTSNIIDILDNSNGNLVNITGNGTITYEGITNYDYQSEAESDINLSNYSVYRIGTDLKIKSGVTNPIVSNYILMFDNFKTRYIKGLIKGTGTTYFELIEGDTLLIFNNISYAYRVLTGNSESESFISVANIAALNTALNTISSTEVFEIRINITYNSGWSSGLLEFKLIR